MKLLSGIASGNIVCLDWNARTLRAVHAAIRRGKIRILGVAEAAVPAEIDVTHAAAFGAFLRETLRKHGIRTDRVVVDIPRQDAVLNPLMLPATTDRELPAMVRFQVEKELPFSLDHGVADYAVQRRNADGTGQIELLVAAIRNHVLEYYKTVCDAAGLQLERVGLRPYATVFALQQGGAMPTTGRIVSVDVGPIMTEINVIRDGHLAFSSAASVRIRTDDEHKTGESRAAEQDVIPFRQTPPPLSSSVDELLVQITRTVEAYRATDPGATIDRVIVAGASPIEQDLAKAVAERLSAPTSIYRPSEELTRPLERRGRVAWSGFGAVLGLAWSHGPTSPSHFDFLHPKEPIDTHRERMRRVPVIAALVAALLLAAGTAVGLKLHRKSQEIAKLDKQLAAAKKEEAAIEDFNKLVTAAQGWRDQGVVWLDELKVVIDTLPSNEDAYLRELVVSNSGEITLKLVGRDGRVFDKLSADLTALKTRKGTPRYVVVPGARTENKKDPKYQALTDIRLQIASLGKKS